MEIENIANVKINKNRGWRGASEIQALDNHNNVIAGMMFSFSSTMWQDLIVRHTIVMEDLEYYYVFTIDDPTNSLPSPTQQRSVLIKNAILNVTNVYKVNKYRYSAETTDMSAYRAITHFRNNENNYTTSEWNYIGVRVTPDIL